MTDRPEDLSARLDTVDQLDSVITAMRSVAAARARHAREQLDGIRAYESTIGSAIGAVLPLLPEPPAASGGGAETGLVIALAAEQGFAGAFSEHVLSRARLHLGGPAELLLVGDRGLMVAFEMGLTPGWTAPMAAHVDEIPALANGIAGALYARLADGRASRASLVYTQPLIEGAGAVTEQALLPFDYGRFPHAAPGSEPLVLLPPARLAERLAEEYVFAELCAALMLSFAAENEARVRAMISARSNVRRTRATLRSTFRQLRQEQITTEIIELSSHRTAGRPRDAHGAGGMSESSTLPPSR